MKKIPTLFDRDWAGDRSKVVDQPHRDCAWVLAGEGQPTRKIDGTSCLLRDGRLFKRRELWKGEAAPPGFEVEDVDPETGKTVGWVPVGEGAEDRWRREGLERLEVRAEGNYELLGPKVQGNPERREHHERVRHDGLGLEEPVPRDFSELKAWLTGRDIEGLVFHHPDGRRAKIKLRDFGLKR